MTKRKSTKRALLLSALSLLMCVSMLIGSTFAWFTDSVQSGNNIIKAGNLDIELEYKKVVDGVATDWATVKAQDNIFDKNALWEPGRVEVVYLRVSNLGSLALKYQLGVNVVNEIIGKTEAGADIKLSDHLVFKVVEMPDALTTYTDREAVKVAAGTEKGLKDYNGTTTALDAKDGANDKDYVALIVYMPETVGNEANYRGTDIPTIELGINLFATQQTAESDSFGAEYDVDAVMPAAKTLKINGGGSITVGNVNVALPAGAEEDFYTVKVDSKFINTDESGDTTVTYDISLLKDGVKVEPVSGVAYTVKIYVGENLNVSTVTHKGTLVADFQYDKTTGEVTFETDSFSPFAVSYYTSVVESVEDFQSLIAKGGEFTLTADMALTEAIVIPEGKKVTLDLNGKNIAITAAYDDTNPSANSAIVNNGELNLIGEGTVNATNNYTVRNYGTMVIDGITVTNGIMNFNDLTVESGAISNSRTGKHTIYNNSAKLVINGGTFHNDNPGNAAIFAYGGSVVLNDGEYTIADGTATLGWTSCLTDAHGNATFAIHGGTYKGTHRDYNNNTVIDGGTFTAKPADSTIAEDYMIRTNSDGTYSVVEKPAAMVGNTAYYTIDEAVAAWKGNTTLTLMRDVTLSDVITIKSTEHHILNLSTYTLTAAEGKNAIEIIACGTGDAERYAITVKADATNPGGINAGKKAVIYYDYSKGGISGNDRPIIKIEGGVFTGTTSGWTTAGIYTKGTAARKCATINISGGTFNCSINGVTKSKLLISGGTFNYSVGSQGDSTALRLISGGTFKSLGWMTADSDNTKFWIGTAMGKSDVGVYVNKNDYLVVGGPVITEAGDRFESEPKAYGSWSSYLKYSSAATYGLYYEK